MKLRLGVLGLAVCCQVVLSSAGERVVKQVLKVGAEERAKLAAIELGAGRAYGKGFVREGDEYICHNASSSDLYGVHWHISMEQMPLETVLLHGQALAESVAGTPGVDFSLYVDVTHMDGSRKWGQFLAFDPRLTGEWQSRDLYLIPEKPVRSYMCYLLFRKTEGRVRFRGLEARRMGGQGWSTFDRNQVRQLESPTKGFLIRDVAAGGDFVAIREQALGVRLEQQEEALSDGGRRIRVKLSNEGKGDRALTLVYSLPLPDGAVVWHHDPVQSQELGGGQLSEAMNGSLMAVGSNGYLSRYPFGAVTVAERGVALGLDPATPVFYRIGCQAATRELYLACDIGLAAEKSSATFNLVVYDYPAEQGFRGALASYYKLFPEAFKVRIARHGIWMPFARISKVEGWEDFGFRFKEGDGEVKWDDEHEMLTFRYTEPMTWWMAMEGEKMSFEQGLVQAKRMAESGDVRGQVWQSSVFEDEHGVPPGSVRFTPWCNGVVWSINSAPGVVGEVTDYSHKFGPNYLKRYDDTSKGDLDGEYVDSAEAYVTLPMNYRRSHFSGMERPLCYSHDTRKVGIYKGMIGFEYVRGLSEEMHRRGKFTMANSTPISWFWLTPLLDVLGTETDWKRGGKWVPMSRADLLYRRALCGGKPYCFLMNSNFDDFSYEDSERFMQRSLAMGFFPGFFSADASTRQYFENPALYNRDRALFKKYIPLCRKLSEIGWEPVTGAETGQPGVWVERFGKVEGERFYLTLFNDTEEAQEVEVSATLFDPQRYSCRELVEGKEVKWQGGKANVRVAAQGVVMLELGVSMANN